VKSRADLSPKTSRKCGVFRPKSTWDRETCRDLERAGRWKMPGMSAVAPKTVESLVTSINLTDKPSQVQSGLGRKRGRENFLVPKLSLPDRRSGRSVALPSYEAKFGVVDDRLQCAYQGWTSIAVALVRARVLPSYTLSRYLHQRSDPKAHGKQKWYYLYHMNKLHQAASTRVSSGNAW
jgi:hypothetical protein